MYYAVMKYKGYISELANFCQNRFLKYRNHWLFTGKFLYFPVFNLGKLMPFEKYRDPSTGRYAEYTPTKQITKEIYLPKFNPDSGKTINERIGSRTARFKSESMRSYIELTKPDGKVVKQIIGSDKLTGETYATGKVTIGGVPIFNLQKNAELTGGQIKSIQGYMQDPAFWDELDDYIEQELYDDLYTDD